MILSGDQSLPRQGNPGLNFAEFKDFGQKRKKTRSLSAKFRPRKIFQFTVIIPDVMRINTFWLKTYFKKRLEVVKREIKSPRNNN